MPAILFGRAIAQSLATAAVLTVVSSGAVLAADYTAEQAEAGKKAYLASCASCHGARLEGPEAPGIFGQDVMGNWDTAGGLYDFISVAMPPAEPGKLGEDVYLAIVAHIMQENGAEPSANPLTVANMADISLVEATKEGAARLAAAAPAGEAEAVIVVPQAYTWGKELPQFNK